MAVNINYSFYLVNTFYDDSVFDGLAVAAVDGGYVYGGLTPAFPTNTATVGTNSPTGFAAQTGTELALAGLTGGKYVAVTQDADSILFHIFATSGSPVTGVIDIGDTGSSAPDVAALKNGGFVIANQDFLGSTDFDIELRFYNSDGVFQFSRLPGSGLGSDRDASVAVLDIGNVAVGWTRTVGAETEVWYAVYSQAGAELKAATLLDTDGTINDSVDLTATGGGFAIAYRDNGGPPGDVAITVRSLDLTGNVLASTSVRSETSGSLAPSISRLANDMLVVNWSDEAQDISLALLDRGTLTALSQFEIEGSSLFGSGVSVAAVYGTSLLALVAPVLPGSLTGHGGESRVREIAPARIIQSDGNNPNLAMKFTAPDDLTHVMIGASGNDKFTGGAADDELSGWHGNDTLDGKGGNDILRGGAGNDGYFVDSEGDIVEESAGSGTDKVTSTALHYTLSADVEHLTLAGNAIQGEGNAQANTITGNDLPNFLYGHGGNDKLDGKEGADKMYGGAGNDTYYVDNAGDQVIEDSPGNPVGKDVVNMNFGGTFTLGANVENGNAIGNADDQILIGNELANILTSKSVANNVLEQNALFGMGGKDTLKGGNGGDILAGGAGADTLIGGGGDDVFRFDVFETSARKDTIKDFSAAQDDKLEFDADVFAGLEIYSGDFLDPAGFRLGTAATTAQHRLIYDQGTGNLWYDEDGTGAAAQVLVAVLSNKANLGAGDIIIY